MNATKDDEGNLHDEGNGRFVSKGDTGFNQPDGDGSSGECFEEFGPRFDGLKGKAAIDKLLETKQGFVPNAFERHDLGGIHLIWGDDDKGLKHIIKRRQETKQDINRLFQNLADVIETGLLTYNPRTGRFEINKNDHIAIVSPTYKNNRFQFVLTAFEIRKINGDS